MSDSWWGIQIVSVHLSSSVAFCHLNQEGTDRSEFASFEQIFLWKALERAVSDSLSFRN